MGAVRVNERGHAVAQRTKALVDSLGLPGREKYEEEDEDEHVNTK